MKTILNKDGNRALRVLYRFLPIVGGIIGITVLINAQEPRPIRLLGALIMLTAVFFSMWEQHVQKVTVYLSRKYTRLMKLAIALFIVGFILGLGSESLFGKEVAGIQTGTLQLSLTAIGMAGLYLFIFIYRRGKKLAELGMSQLEVQRIRKQENRIRIIGAVAAAIVAAFVIILIFLLR